MSQPLTSGAWPARRASLLFGAAALGCQPVATSPPERLQPSRADAAIVSPCLAQTHPILTHTSTAPRSRLIALTVTGGGSLPLGTGSFIYGSTWAPDGRSIAFRRREISVFEGAVATELALFAPDAGEEVVLTLDSSPATGTVESYPDEPTWSPDGRELAFASRQGSEHYRIWAIARTGGRSRLLLPVLEAVPHSYPSWSPKAERLAYVAEGAVTPDLWVVDLATGAPQNLTAGAMESVTSPAWSPDGERIAFSALARVRPEEQGNLPDIFIIDVASTELWQVTTGGYGNIEPAWSPDGSRLLVSSTRPSTAEGPRQPFNLWLLTLDGSRAPEQLTDSRATTSGTDWYRFETCDSGR